MSVTPANTVLYVLRMPSACFLPDHHVGKSWCKFVHTLQVEITPLKLLNNRLYQKVLPGVTPVTQVLIQSSWFVKWFLLAWHPPYTWKKIADTPVICVQSTNRFLQFRSLSASTVLMVAKPFSTSNTAKKLKTCSWRLKEFSYCFFSLNYGLISSTSVIEAIENGGQLLWCERKRFQREFVLCGIFEKFSWPIGNRHKKNRLTLSWT